MKLIIYHFHILNVRLLLACISIAFGSIGLINTGRNNLANIIKKNLENYAEILKNSSNSVYSQGRILKRLKQDLLVYSRATLYLFLCMVIAFIQILITAYTSLIDSQIIYYQDNHKNDLIEGALFSLSLTGCLINLLGIIVVLANRRQNLFKASW